MWEKQIWQKSWPKKRKSHKDVYTSKNKKYLNKVEKFCHQIR